MGNTSKKLAAKCTLLTKEEQKYVAATFRAASKNSEKIREEDLIVSGKLDAVSLEEKVYSKPIQDLGELRQRITEATEHNTITREDTPVLLRYHFKVDIELELQLKANSSNICCNLCKSN
ncbi:unnamed protein product [Euphydryas editha]|uniref:Uncharacterized protein n=1 Tax=Euphydryas editha TaxID=104508 RepID=A0AAU9UEP0_EUPED|nr:unnamed protein product [Euphydryas editha]